MKSMSNTVVVVPNWNGKDNLKPCLESLQKQSLKPHIILVDNGSTDGSVEFVEKEYPAIEIVRHGNNLGYSGGVNPGFLIAQQLGSRYVAPFNNDAVADKDWLLKLTQYLDDHTNSGIATCKLLSMDNKYIDSTGDLYTNWGLPYPRGRGESDINKYDRETEVFAGSGAASLYRVSMLRKIGVLDDDFFAYYEDVDLSFRAQLAGWKVAFVPDSIVYHATGNTSKKLKGFATYQTMKNLPWVYWKNVPTKYLFRVGWRFKLAYFAFFFSAVRRGQGWPALKGLVVSLMLSPKKLVQRWQIQSSKKVTPEYIWEIMTHDLPPNAKKLRSLRASWWRMLGKSTK